MNGILRVGGLCLCFNSLSHSGRRRGKEEEAQEKEENVE